LLSAFGVTEISDDQYRSNMGVIVISSGTPHSSGENTGCILEILEAPVRSLGALRTCLRAPLTTLEALPICLGKILSSLGTLLVRLEIIATTECSMIV
jgi:hypothetical protein